jgi:hypothetical protein
MRPFIFAVLSVALVSCSGGSAPVAAPPATSPVGQAGVVADTDRGPLTLSTFSLGLAHQLPVKSLLDSVPKVKSVKAFVVNVPNVTGTDASLYWVNDPDLIFSGKPESLPSQVSNQSGQGGYSITAAALNAHDTGYVMLVLKSANGGLSRYYAVQLGAS